jgi:hypothetical protein
MSYERDAWDQTGDMSNGIEGAHLKCAKGTWLLDDERIEIGESGIKICVIMESATVGEILWRDHKIVDRNVGRIADGHTPPRQITEGWNPYVAFQAVRADEGHLGELVTFTSSSWGGRYAFQSLVNPFRLKGRQQFPICLLATKERGDANGNIDPVFRIVGWSDRGNFQDLLAPEPAPAIAPPTAPVLLPTPKQPALAEIIKDDIPF